MKKAYGKLSLWFAVLPIGASFLMTALYCLFSNMYLEWYWVTEWICYLPESIALYLEYALVYLSLGILAYHIHFENGKISAVLASVTAILVFAVPCLRYVIRHFFFVNTMSKSNMEEMFLTDIFDAIYLLSFFLLGLLVILILRATYALILLQKPMAKGKIFTVKHPVGLAMTIYFAANSTIATIMFITTGEFAKENILSLLMEYGINAAGFTLAILGGFAASCLLSQEKA